MTGERAVPATGPPAPLRALPALVRREPALAGIVGRGDATLAVAGAAQPFVLAGLARLSDSRPFLVVTATAADAERLAGDLSAFLDPTASGARWPTCRRGRPSPSSGSAPRSPPWGSGSRCSGNSSAGRRRAPCARRWWWRRCAPCCSGSAPGRARPARSWSRPGAGSTPRPPSSGWWPPATAGSTRWSTAARWRSAAGSSTSSPRRPTPRCASTCGVTRWSGSPPSTWATSARWPTWSRWPSSAAGSCPPRHGSGRGRRS